MRYEIARATHEAGFLTDKFWSDVFRTAKLHGLDTARAIARDVGLHENTVNRANKDKSPSLVTALLLCDWFGLDPRDYLLRPRKTPAEAGAND